mmetsp:Transcript_31084/g.36950  ORF Transcript_31084/g.36950 Transcript_31084/m.36950 type:complete len:189 (-) Transcript_31084:67-633(-)
MCMESLSCMEDGGVFVFVSGSSEAAAERRSVIGAVEADGEEDVLSLVFVVTISTATCAMLVTAGGEAAVVLVIVTIGISPSPVDAIGAVFFMRPEAMVTCLSSNGEDCFIGLSFNNDADDESADVAIFRTFGINTNLFADDAIMMLFIYRNLFQVSFPPDTINLWVGMLLRALELRSKLNSTSITICR